MKSILSWVLILFIVCVSLIFGYLISSFLSFEKQILTVNISFEIKQNDNIKIVLKRLYKEDVTHNYMYTILFYYKYRNDYKDIKKWTYTLDGEYTLHDIVKSFQKWPPAKQTQITVLEWWSSFDVVQHVDANVTVYNQLVNDKYFVESIKNEFEFLSSFWDIQSLEWFLYPDTYFFKEWEILDNNFSKLLIKKQLKAFEEKVWNPYNWELLKFHENIAKKDKSFVNTLLSPYEVITIASIVEKEEKNTKNKPTISYILLKRYSLNMLIWADIALCYWLEIDYNACTPQTITKYIQSNVNWYNTRVVRWLTPTPIWNPSVSTIQSVLFSEKTDYLYYLHDKEWQVRYGKTLQQHNINKSKYLR